MKPWVVSTWGTFKQDICARAASSGHRNRVPTDPQQIALEFRGHRMRDDRKLFQDHIFDKCDVVLIVR